MSAMRNDNESWTGGQAPSFPPPPQPLGVRRRYGNGRRLFYGSLWSLYTVLLVVGGIGALAAGQVLGGLLGLLLGVLAGRYAYRIWTWQAKHLWFLIIF